MKCVNKYSLTTLFLLFFNQLGLVQASEKDEYEVKAKFLCAFLKYTQFADTDNEFRIGIVGINPFKGHLKKLAKSKINGRNIKLIFFKNNYSAEAVSKCHLAFISQSEHLRQKEILKSLTSKKTLTIGDNKWFLKGGGMINFRVISKSIRWEINLDSIRQSDLKISSKILRLSVNHKRTK